MDTTERTAIALERIADALETIAGAVTTANQPQAAATTNLPTFAGYSCSWTLDAAGNPSYIITADGEIADKHERQGDLWYSVKDENVPGGYRRILTIKASEILPAQAQWTPPQVQPQKTTQAPQAPPADPDAPPPENSASERTGDAQAAHIDTARQQAAEPKAEAPEQGNPFEQIDEPTLRQLHALGRAVHGDEGWRKTGPERVTAHSDGRAKRSDQLSHAEATRLIAELTQLQHNIIQRRDSQ